MTASACAPVSRLQSCFNETLSVAHTHWAKKVVLDFRLSLSSGLLAELGGVSATGTDGASQAGKGNRGVASFKTTWRQEWVELDSDVSADADGNREQVSLPTSVSASLAAYLFFLTHSAACSLISVDTVQQLPPSNLFAPTDTTSSASALEDMQDTVSQVNRMALFASSSLYSSAIAAVGDTYSSLLRSASTSTSTTSPSQEKEGLQSEDVALQVRVSSSCPSLFHPLSLHMSFSTPLFVSQCPAYCLRVTTRCLNFSLCVRQSQLSLSVVIHLSHYASLFFAQPLYMM